MKSITVRVAISDRTMVANSFDGGEFERLFPLAQEVPTKRRSSSLFDVGIIDAIRILDYVEGCPAAQGAENFGEGTPESYAQTAAVRSTVKQIRRKIDAALAESSPDRVAQIYRFARSGGLAPSFSEEEVKP